MTGPQIPRNAKALSFFAKGDRVVSAAGNGGRIQKMFQDAASVLWDNGEEFSIRLAHLQLEEDVVQQQERGTEGVAVYGTG